MKQQLKDCNPTINNRTDLMTNEFEFMDKESIKERCTECNKQEVCIRIVNLLLAKRPDEALDLIKYTDAKA